MQFIKFFLPDTKLETPKLVESSFTHNAIEDERMVNLMKWMMLHAKIISPKSNLLINVIVLHYKT